MPGIVGERIDSFEGIRIDAHVALSKYGSEPVPNISANPTGMTKASGVSVTTRPAWLACAAIAARLVGRRSALSNDRSSLPPGRGARPPAIQRDQIG